MLIFFILSFNIKLFLNLCFVFFFVKLRTGFMNSIIFFISIFIIRSVGNKTFYFFYVNLSRFHDSYYEFDRLTRVVFWLFSNCFYFILSFNIELV